MTATKINNTENWKNVIRPSIGTTYKYDDSSAWCTRFRTHWIPSGDRYWLSFGASLQFYKTHHLDLAYTYIFFNKTRINEPAIENGIFTGIADQFR
ncbi:outer membrane protein transport protein [Nitrosomonas sp.]|uniref:outer membrane protein transport protein n=1 Tax=Nitrosomonas sp. TaxID=42353 RepID=UPI0028428A49|nr:outer membrane protein transport protein [Nitrosomonas sp.]MDR4513674.1 outer membrane protein transport protein [Nitrosomonas sp.]